MSEKFIPAFKDKLVRSDFEKKNLPYDKLYEFQNNPNYVVRKALEWQMEFGQSTDPKDIGAKLTTLFSEIENSYGIKAPVHFVIADDESGSPSLFIITDRINSVEDQDLTEEEKLRKVQGIGQIFENLSKYYEDKYESGEDFLSDIPDPEQYVFGSKVGDISTDWYLVDTDSFYSNDKESLFEAAEALYDETEVLEEQYGISLQKVRDKAKSLMTKLESEID